MPDAGRPGERIFRGIPVSPGVCRGKIVVLGKGEDATVGRRLLAEEEIPEELKRLEHALVDTRRQILNVQRQLAEGLGAEDASIFDAHLLVLEDPALIEEVTRLIKKERVNAAYAFQQVSEKYIRTLSAIQDEYLRERATDMRDVTARVVDHLAERNTQFDLSLLKEPCVIISYDLTPSQTAQINKDLVKGFATDIGGRTSHTAIMARSLRIPAVVGLHSASQELASGDYALLDGFNGLIIINPTEQTLFEYGQLVRKRVTLEDKLRETIEQPAVTLDGVRITLSANVERSEDAEAVSASGAEGVGLFRTEYLFINRDTLPSEEEQYAAYRRVASALKPHPVVIRTLDLGGDKFLSHLQVAQEMNPFLGWRAIRFCLQERDIFRAQLRAILRASVDGNVLMMYPMISGLEELQQANALLEECKVELAAEGVPYNPALPVGAMIEIPSAVMVAPALAKRAKFFSIGTNDLIQYSLAVDRLNEKIAHLYEPTHPAILRFIKMTADAGKEAGIWVGVCGEMAGDPLLLPLLLGLGVTELSAAPGVVPQLKYLIRRLKMSEAVELADWALQCESGAGILDRCRKLVRQVAPSLCDSP
ncbi:MAG TPA: phosphoenolpyruvate--protein phosphotransferase [Candidatus Saccharimonadales bacterium]|nr:phosphoenolpyruvate--protein phosphotransferase [Candidatus Saccharimonadales bacterium]